MAPQPEQQARGSIDRLLEAAGWHVCDAAAANIDAAREFPLRSCGLADYFRYSDDESALAITDKNTSLILSRALP